MNSARADELRLILPLLPRLATADFFGTDDFRERVEVLLGFDDVLRDRVEDDEREDREEDRPLFAPSQMKPELHPLRIRTSRATRAVSDVES